MSAKFMANVHTSFFGRNPAMFLPEPATAEDERHTARTRRNVIEVIPILNVHENIINE